MTTLVVAVSGGVDSVVLLHLLHTAGKHKLIVAHVDHGIRDDSAQDAAFVRELAKQYGATFELSTHALGSQASEEQARTIRYSFLRDVARPHDASIVTAHHADDIVETIAINLHRGTGWRGLATHDSDVIRPLLGYSKAQLYEYARRHELEWREDWTNDSDAYLRNRFRKRLVGLPSDTRESLLTLRHRQIELKQAIAEEVARVVGEGPNYSRYFFTYASHAAALECLRTISEGRLTRPQLERLMLAIKTTGTGKTIQLGDGISAHFTSRNFSLSLIK